jgi:chemotaxis protein MotA
MAKEDLLALIKQRSAGGRVRKDAIGAENEAQNIVHPFFKKGLMLVADGIDAEALNGILHLQNLAVAQRHKVGQEVLKAIGKWAPAFGMIGTLIGLVQMLSNMNDPKALGPAMAVALLTTLYGALIANLFALPMAAKLKQRPTEILIMVITEG